MLITRSLITDNIMRRIHKRLEMQPKHFPKNIKKWLLFTIHKSHSYNAEVGKARPGEKEE